MMYYRNIITFIPHLISIFCLFNVGSAEIDKCNQCKVLSHSFNKWLQKTARGKYEGGDTAWEEAKLKSYSRSETRLVEIQEGLCSEVEKHKDQCYALAQETEHLLEQWWVHEDPNLQDFFTWLCISTLQYCSPNNNYGPLSTASPVDKNGKICGKQELCDGKNACICKKGLPWNKDVNKNQENICKANEYCENQEGSYCCKVCDGTCKTCSGKGHTNCTSCHIGRYLIDGICYDPEGYLIQHVISGLIRIVFYILAFIILVYVYEKVQSTILSGVLYIIFLFVLYKNEIEPIISLGFMFVDSIENREVKCT